jgi:hypothetical protein
MFTAIIDLLSNFFGADVWANILFAFKVVLYSGFVWLPILFLIGLGKVWMKYIRAYFIQKQGAVLLEIKIPKEMNKSPAAMEVFISHLHQAGKPSYIEAYWEGKIRPWFSLELVSIEGDVKFFIWTHKKFKSIVEAQIYAQYPTVEVYEVPDYVAVVPYNPNQYQYFGVQWKLLKADAYPLRTYIDYGLDKDPKEEFKIDPITSVLEFLGSMKAGEQAWIQILIRAHREEGLKDGRLFKKADWKKAAKAEIKKIASESLLGDGDAEKGTTLKLTKGQQETIAALERSLGKFPFDTVVRGMYVAKQEVFNSANIGGLMGVVKQYGSPDLNGFKPGFSTSVDYPWQDFRGKRVAKWKKQLFDAYKHRSYFYPPYKDFKSPSYVLTTEELATLWHFPGGVAGTPTFSRVTSKKGEAPSNLPI